MAGVSIDVASLGGLILECANKIQELGGNWYKATAELEEFPQQVKRLLEKVDVWETAASNRGVFSDPLLIQCLENVKSSLEQERDKLQRRANKCGAGCVPRLRTTVFPVTLGKSIQLATDMVDSIPKTLRFQEEVVEAVDRRRMHMPYKELITDDSRYVPFQVSTADICEALDNLDRPAVVLLHGGAGKGKSTLARAMVVHYNSEKKGRFAHVSLLTCSPNANVENTLFEILRRLDSQVEVRSQSDGDGDLLRKQVRGLLANQKILLILDDVSDSEFLERIVELCGTRVKCLVTSQHADLCRAQDPSNFIKIKIQDTSKEDARKILASHVGLPNQQIPGDIQAVADEMISKTDSSPLALASLANVIDQGRADELDEWKEASTNFLAALQCEVPAALFLNKYPKSFWISMGQTISTLTEDSKLLLVLTSACQGLSVPEGIVHIFFRSAMVQRGSKKSVFSNARKELESRQLIKITRASDLTSSNNLGQHRTWFLHSLHKRYIEGDPEMRKSRDCIFNSALASQGLQDQARKTEDDMIRGTKSINDEFESIVPILWALYLEKELSDKAASKMGISVWHFQNLRRNAIEPITLLLARYVNDHDQETRPVRDHAMKVFVEYICHRALDGEGISYLLRQPETTSAVMWSVLKDITFISYALFKNGDNTEAEDWCLKDENTEGIIEVLADQLAEGVESRMQQVALEILDSLCENGVKSGFYIVSSSVILNGIARILETPSDSPVKSVCVSVLDSFSRHMRSGSGALLRNMDVGNRDVLLGWVGIFNGLLRSISKEKGESVGQVLVFICSSLWYKLAMSFVKHTDVLNGLANALSKNGKLKYYALRALVNLSEFGCTIMEHVVDHPRVLPELVKALSFDADLRLQEEAARAISNLARGYVKTKKQIINSEGMITELVKSLAKDVSPRLQSRAARALGNLAVIEEVGENRGEIFNDSRFAMVEGLQRLVQRMETHHIRPSYGRREAQKEAAKALTLFEPALGSEQCLQSASAYAGRAEANFLIGRYNKAREDIDKADELHPNDSRVLRSRRTIIAKMGDIQGALEAANHVIAAEDYWFIDWQERGILKRMTGDLPGALADLNRAFELSSNYFSADYSTLKHKAYVKFLLKDEEGARADADEALRSPEVDDCEYRKSLNTFSYLGESSVEFLEFKLT